MASSYFPITSACDGGGNTASVRSPMIWSSAMPVSVRKDRLTDRKRKQCSGSTVSRKTASERLS
jgi:hypothetical protein